ncbi:MAG: PAS domain-containing sensor histidine kinase [Agriterribacter sp.]
MDRILKGEHVGKFRTIRTHKQGHNLHVSLTISPVRNERGEIIGAAKIARDISTEVALEERLMQNNLALQQSSMYKDEVIGILAHELRTPLTTLKACIQLSRENPEHADELIDKAEEQVNHISGMLTDLLDITKIQAGRLEIKKTIVDVGEFVNKAIWIVQQSNPSHSIEYSAEAGSVLIKADPSRMEQVMINLLSNAVKYSPDANKVIVQVRPVEEFVEVSVRDFGLGIPPEELEKIWTKFYRVKAHRNRIKGLGMGLHICKQLVMAHGGKIWAESNGREGTTFFVRVPLASSSQSL